MTEIVNPPAVGKSTRDGFGQALLKLGEENEQVVALSANLCESTRTLEFAKKFPARYIEIGVAEQNMAGVAAGLALGGKIPFMTSFAAFSPALNWGQIRISICYNQANVKITSTHAGLSVGADGAGHQALEDIAMMRVLPNLIVLSPCDANEAHQATLLAAKHQGPVYLRLGREPLPAITKPDATFNLGQIQTVKEGKDAVIIATGSLVYQALQAANELAKQNISLAVLNCHTIKPLDEETIIQAAKRYGMLITAEEHQIAGGLGSAVAEVLSSAHPTPLLRLGVNDSFGESGLPSELFKKHHLDSQAIIDAVKRLIAHTQYQIPNT